MGQSTTGGTSLQPSPFQFSSGSRSAGSWHVWKPDQAAEDRLRRTLCGAASVCLLTGAVVTARADSHIDCSHKEPTFDGFECVGELIEVPGPHRGRVLVLAGAAAFAFWCDMRAPQAPTLRGMGRGRSPHAPFEKLAPSHDNEPTPSNAPNSNPLRASGGDHADVRRRRTTIRWPSKSATRSRDCVHATSLDPTESEAFIVAGRPPS